ncbi:related to acyl-coa thioester hydrolase [Melanopsichium pennsylvanicum]|uniref:Related to acyl-coa thioester hydrolase n=2 Tax=Melanopsichium pennsylvanicum TaxID=63383 RepID=A0AAJ5C8W0_9BASI|nr:related to acyl-coa thioester hydrolase [Melanopsichium pennsylvanicum 4]SNX88049.1 related to acyl-coa thioester hydrolase [Melanopsichium pennsylvanicum]
MVCPSSSITRTLLCSSTRIKALFPRCSQLQRRLTQQASPLQETNAVREIHKLMAEVRGAHPQKLKLSMPTRLAPRRSWMKEMQSQALASSSIPAQPTISTELPESLLKPKRMQDSYVELYLPFTEDPELLEKYIATSGLIRLGKVLEDLDSLAGSISYQHALGGRPGEISAPIYIVTASVDRLDLLAPLTADANYRLSGHVIYVGSSSMEVFVSIEQLTEPMQPNKICLTGRFTMAARNAHTLSSQRIAPLITETDAEISLFAMGENHKNRKRTEAASSLEKVPPSKEEAFLLHSQYIRGLHAGMFATDELHGPAIKLDPVQKPAGPTLVPVRTTSLSTTMHMHPQQRNVHQKIFGGFLMRSAYELAWMASASFVNRHVHFLSLDALSFHAPVPIGAMLQLSSQIAYTSEPEQHPQRHTIAGVTVLAQVVDLETGERKTSNTFHFSFDLGTTDRQVLPQTYKEAMEFIEGKRRVEIGAEMRRLYQEPSAKKPHA